MYDTKAIQQTKVYFDTNLIFKFSYYFKHLKHLGIVHIVFKTIYKRTRQTVATGWMNYKVVKQLSLLLKFLIYKSTVLFMMYII